MKGMAPLIGAIVLLFIVGVLFVRPGAIADAGCYTPGNPIKVTIDPIRILKSSPNSYICAYQPYYNSAGQFKWSSQCRLFGAVTQGQVVTGESFGLRAPEDIQTATVRIAINIADKDSTANGNVSVQIPQFINSISEEDYVTVNYKNQCPAAVPTGERAVNYFVKCDNTNPDQGKIVYCEKEFFSGATSYCSGERFVICEKGATCLQSGDVGICFQKQGPAFAKCGDQWDNQCPAGCLLYQDRDCCVQSGAEWDVFASVCRIKSGATVSTTDQLTKAKQEQESKNFVALVIGATVLALIILIIVIALGIFISPIRALTGFIYTPMNFIITLAALSLIFIIFVAGSSLGAASIVGIS